MSSFSALNVGARAIHAAQRGLDVTGQNISNVSTVGYSRQRVDQVAVGGPAVPVMWSKYDGAGGGVNVTGVSRVRNEFLEARARTAHASAADLATQQSTMEAVERTVGEPSATGLQSQIQDFWNSWSKVSNDPLGDAPRNLTFEKAQSVANQLNNMSNQLTVQYDDTRNQLDANVTDVNKMADDIASLNKAIRNSTVNNVPANELADQRDQLVEKLTNLTGGTAVRGQDGVVDVKLGDTKIVDGTFALNIKIDSGAPATYADRLAQGSTPTATTFQWTTGANSGALTAPSGPVTVASGTMRAQVQALDTTIPGYVGQLDEVASKLASTTNDLLTGANGQPTYTVDGKAGTPLFQGATAATIVVTPGMQPRDIAVSHGDPTAGQLDGNVAKDLAGSLGTPTGPDEAFRKMVVELGVETQSVNRNAEVQAKVASSADDARDSVSGVSLDEEMTNLIQYQHSYTAAAKYVSTIDSTIQSLLDMVR